MTAIVPVPTPTPPSPQADPWPEAVARAGASVVALAHRRRGTSSGVLWKAGVVVGSASAIGHAERVRLTRPDGESVIAPVRGIDPSTDLAVIDVSGDPGRGLPACERRLAVATLRAGDAVAAVGREASGLLHASFGRIGAAGGAWRTWRGGAVDALLRLDGGLYPGLEGAPLIDAEGLVIGLGSAALARHHGIVLPPATVDRVVEQVLTHGRVAQGYLGIAAQTVALGKDGHGLLVSGLSDEGPAARAGLLVGDIVLGVGGEAVSDIEGLRALLGGASIGTRVRLSVLRGGQAVDLAVEVGERPSRRCH